MDRKTTMHMTVSIDIQPEGLNLACWMSPENSNLFELENFKHRYFYQNGGCTWEIHSSGELTNKLVAAVSEYGQKICDEQAAANARRKLANR